MRDKDRKMKGEDDEMVGIKRVKGERAASSIKRKLGGNES